MRFSMSPGKLVAFAKAQRLSTECFRWFESPEVQRTRSEHPVIGFGLAAVRALVKLLTAGNVDTDMSDCVLVLRKASDANIQTVDHSVLSTTA